MATQPNFLGHLSESLSALLAKVLDDAPVAAPVLSFFRRPSTLANAGFQLDLTRHEFAEESKGTLVDSRDGDRVVVFRQPTRLRATFRLSHPSLAGAERLQALDRLTNWFFDHRSIEPIFPDRIAQFPALHEALSTQRGELKLLTPSDGFFQGFQLNFEYAALFHSGTALREETRVRTRNVLFNDQNHSERSHS